MEYKEHIHFAGKWEEAEQETVVQAVQVHEAALEAMPEADAGRPWVCLRIMIHGDVYYLGYRLGEEHVLKATAAHVLAQKIEAFSAKPVSGAEASEIEIPRGGIPPYRLRKVIDFVRSNLDCPVTVAQLAEEARLSEAHFSRLFKQSLGLTPMQYLTQCRVEQAQRLLLNTDLRIEEIAHRIGLKSASHFAEVFRRRIGMTPRAYRNRYRP